MEFMQTALIGFVLFIVLALVFRRYITALIYDYVVDAGFSFADNFLGGAGLVGLDFGDWIAALLIFLKERKITGGFAAGLVAWEATNFIPFSLIPGIGELLEIFFNFFPAVTIGRLLFNKYSSAEKEEHKLEEDVSISEQLGIDISKEKSILRSVKRLIASEDPADALKEGKKSEIEMSSNLMGRVSGLITDTNTIISNISHQNIQAPQELISILQEGITESRQLLQQAESAAQREDWKTAINSAMFAKTIIISAAQHFEGLFGEYKNRLRNKKK